MHTRLSGDIFLAALLVVLAIQGSRLALAVLAFIVSFFLILTIVDGVRRNTK
jgi:ABC-type bacteriocin/lantibiotic exporter with double-glycine peptidase domain